ncbi:MAG: hypothetical protein M1818_004976 [Claussenomyces sp. TS43310]|nr:MAG: hypothetical protein M1818_004976 [Claussenomyces sp. TS43310]
MDSFPNAQFTTTRNFVYNYVKIPPKQQGASLLFLHGFPSSSYDWRYQISYFASKGYGIIAPDTLGYGGTSKPLDTQAYKGKLMAEDIAEILKFEKIETVIGIGHDWGSFLLSRLAVFYPSLFTKLVFMDIGYSVPGRGLSLDTINHVNAAVQAALGYSVFGYFKFFQDEDAASLLNDNCESAQSMFFSKDNELGKKYMGAEGGFRTWLTEGKVAPYPPFVSTEDKGYFRKQFSPDNGGFGPSINWYKAALADIDAEDVKEIPKERYTLLQPTLLISSDNFITATADFPSQMKPFAPNLVNKKLTTGHWIMLEQPDEVNKMLEEFFA